MGWLWELVGGDVAKGGIQVSGFHSQRMMGPLVEMGKMGSRPRLGDLAVLTWRCP